MKNWIELTDLNSLKGKYGLYKIATEDNTSIVSIGMGGADIKAKSSDLAQRVKEITQDTLTGKAKSYGKELTTAVMANVLNQDIKLYIMILGDKTDLTKEIVQEVIDLEKQFTRDIGGKTPFYNNVGYGYKKFMFEFLRPEVLKSFPENGHRITANILCDSGDSAKSLRPSAKGDSIWDNEPEKVAFKEIVNKYLKNYEFKHEKL